MDEYQEATKAAGKAAAARHEPISSNPYRGSPLGHFKRLERLWDEGWKYKRRLMERRKT